MIYDDLRVKHGEFPVCYVQQQDCIPYSLFNGHRKMQRVSQQRDSWKMVLQTTKSYTRQFKEDTKYWTSGYPISRQSLWSICWNILNVSAMTVLLLAPTVIFHVLVLGFGPNIHQENCGQDVPSVTQPHRSGVVLTLGKSQRVTRGCQTIAKLLNDSLGKFHVLVWIRHI